MIYPNPAQSYFIVLVEDEKLLPLQLKIFSYSGSMVEEDIIYSNGTEIPIGGNIINGVYIVQLYNEDRYFDNKKLAVSR